MIRKILLPTVACAGMLAACAETINVLALGAKNDGSADVSAIVNANTAKSALFFPAGIYKVSQPLLLKNSIRGEGYARLPRVDATRTWFVSEIACTNGAVGVIELDGASGVPVNVENLSIKCASRECGIRIGGGRRVPYTLIDKVGVFGVGAWGLYVKGGGSRAVFAGNMTIWGTTTDPTARAVGIRVEGAPDCRLSNIEAMGVNIGMELYNGHTYGDNMHLWTGVMGQHEPTWWNDTRGIVLGPCAHFTGSEIYPDTCYYAFDMKDASSLCEIMNVMYWEDNSVKSVKNRTGDFLHFADAQRPGKLVLNGTRIQADRYTQATSMPGVFVGGDAHRGPEDIVNAVYEAKVAAASIDRYLGGAILAGQDDRRLSGCRRLHSRRHDCRERGIRPRLR